ncbi:MAG TPA: hypothetical protein VEM96_20840 [Pyrinomonadaceae bacterium]|nr:hypothetical protein [Pyrinomonadaceae bacterium]
MTLLAGFQHQDVPLLLGDFMILAGPQAYTRKKVHLISSNLAVGWTGHVFLAKPILRDLYRMFNGTRVSQQELENFLTGYPIPNPSSMLVHLVGWIADDEPRCFLWNSSFPSQLFYEPYHVDGSGSNAFENVLKSEEHFAIQGPPPSNIDEAIYFALFKATALMSDEVLSKANRKIGFGYGYELLYLDGNEFKFVDDVLYSTWEFYYDLNSKGGNVRFYPTVYKYRSFDYYSVIQTYSFRSKTTEFNIVTPVFDDMPNVFSKIPGVDVAKGVGFPLTSRWYCLYFRFQASDNTRATGSLVFPVAQPNSPFHIDKVDGKESLYFKFDFLQTLYRLFK